MLSIVVPLYNEAENTPKLVTDIKGCLKGTEYELILVDDNSPDGTGEIARRMAQKNGSIRVIQRERKLGVASAIAAGVKAARGEVIGTINADMQHPPEILPVMLEQTAQYDIVIGSRYVNGGCTRDRFLRQLVSRGATAIASIILPRVRRVKDPMSGLFLFKREVVADSKVLPSSLSGNVSTGVKFLLQILVKGDYKSVIEVPYYFEKRKNGRSKFAFRDYIAYLRYLLHLIRTSGELKRIVKFCMVGVSGIGIYTVLLFLLTDRLGLLYLLSAVMSWLVATTSNFVFNELWTFRDLRKRGSFNTFKRGLKSTVFRVAGAGLNVAVLFCLTDLLGIYYLVSALIAVTIVLMWNYITCLNFVWRK